MEWEQEEVEEGEGDGACELSSEPIFKEDNVGLAVGFVLVSITSSFCVFIFI